MPHRHYAVLSILLAGLLLAAPAVTAQPSGPLARSIDGVLDRPAFDNAFWGVQVVDLRTGRTLYEGNAGKSFMPASNTKLYTTAAALEQLGPDYRYRTELYVDGPVVGGVLQGNVVVRGSGDPVVGGRFNDNDRTETFRGWAAALRAAGVARIAGDLIGDDDVFDDTALGYGWSWDDETYWYSAELSGLSFNDNNVDFAIRGRTQGAPAEISWEPDNTTYVEVVNQTRTIAASRSIDEGYDRARGTNRIEISSLVPEGRTDYESLTVTNPTLFFVHVLRETFLREGLPVDGRPVDVDELSIKPDYGAPGMQRVAVHESVPLADIVTVVNKRSQNLYADQLLKTLGAVFPAADPDVDPGSAEMGLLAARQTWGRAGADTSRIQLVDGSGLSRQNLVTPAMTASLLAYMWAHPDAAVRDAFYASLPIGGVDGTLESRFREGRARQNVRAKTGTISNASTLGGYVTAADGRPLAFVLMCNHYTVPTRFVREAQDAVVELLARSRE